jgi:hypothetical protein
MKYHEKPILYQIPSIPVPLGHKELEKISESIKYEKLLPFALVAFID